MTLSAIELMDLSDKLDALMSKAATASGMELLDISDEIDRDHATDGYGVSGGSSGEGKQPSVHDGVPKLVADFWLINSSIRAPMHLSVRYRT